MQLLQDHRDRVRRGRHDRRRGGAGVRARGATVFLAGRTQATLERSPTTSIRPVGRAEAARSTPSTPTGVREHVDAVVGPGSIDVSMNIISHPVPPRRPVSRAEVEDFEASRRRRLRSNLVTARGGPAHGRAGQGAILTYGGYGRPGYRHTAARSRLRRGRGVPAHAVGRARAQGVRVITLQSPAASPRAPRGHAAPRGDRGEHAGPALLDRLAR